MDKIYLTTNDNEILFLDCTRLEDSNILVSRNNVNDITDVDVQIRNLSILLFNRGINEIILADDVVFSGSVLRTIIKSFSKYKIKVVGIRCAVSTFSSYIKFNEELSLGLKCGYLLGCNVLDQICERDFYFGIAQSGISVIGKDGLIYKSPYFKPFGKPVKRASIPKDFEKYFSKGCINRSIELWNEIERISSKIFYVDDLPEMIVNTNKNEEVIKTLKKGINKI